MSKMGNTTHDVWIQDNRIHLANEQDPHYLEVFRNEQEVAAFIKKLQAIKEKLYERP